MSLIEIRNVNKVYQSGGQFHSIRTNALRGIDLNIEKCECLAVVGESGSGKSTLGRLVVGLENPTDGSISYNGCVLDAKHIDKNTRQALQMVYQNSFESTNPRFTARQIIEEPLRYFHLHPRNERNGVIDELLQKVGIPLSEASKRSNEFSGGQLQRICIARALAAQPTLILLDEPLSSLDVSVQAQILNLLKQFRREYGLTYLLISHDLETVYNLADRVVVMYFGKIVEAIDDIELFDSMHHPYTELLLGRDAQANMYTTERLHETDSGCVYADRCPKADSNCWKQVPELREAAPGHRIACLKC